MAPFNWFGGKKNSPKKEGPENVSADKNEVTRKPITVTEIPLEHAQTGRGDIDLGANKSDQRETQRTAGGLLDKLQRMAEKAYKVEWNGNMFPAHSRVGNRIVMGLTQGLIVGVGPDNPTIGTYQHIEPTSNGRNVTLLFFLKKKEGQEDENAPE